MAIVHFVKSKRTQTVGSLKGVLDYCCKEAKVDYEGRPLVSGVNCVPAVALQEFMNTKRQFGSTHGRMYYHMVQSFHPDDPVTPEMAHEIALKLAESIPGFEIVVATHTDKEHIHSHFVINSVSCDTGKKVSQQQGKPHGTLGGVGQAVPGIRPVRCETQEEAEEGTHHVRPGVPCLRQGKQLEDGSGVGHRRVHDPGP